MQAARCHFVADSSLTVSGYAKRVGYRPISEYFFSLDAIGVVVVTFNLCLHVIDFLWLYSLFAVSFVIIIQYSV
jgi:hypothetical protein